MSLQTCTDISEAIPLDSNLGLYLKPTSKIKISVQLPVLKIPGQNFSNWQVTEKLKSVIRPDQFIYLKTIKITPTLIKFQGEFETQGACDRALARLHATSGLKLTGFSEWLQIRAAKEKCLHPTRHDWDAFFRDARGVDEMKPGERPDTVYIQDLPVRWFAESHHSEPSTKNLWRAFSNLGRIRRLEVPSQFEHVDDLQTFGKVSSFHKDLLFEVYIQYEEYVEFVSAMDMLRGKKLVYKDPEGNIYATDIKVDFDRTNYLSDRCIKQRALEAQKIKMKENIMDPLKLDTNSDINTKKSSCLTNEAKNSSFNKDENFDNEAFYLLKELLRQSEATEIEKQAQKKAAEIEEERQKQLRLEQQKHQEELKRQNEEYKKKQEKLMEQERMLKEKLLRNLKAREKKKTAELREKLRKELAGRKVLKSVLVKNSDFNIQKKKT